MRFLPPLIELLAAVRRDEDGAVALEYALIATLIAVVIVGAVVAVGIQVVGLFTPVTPAL